MNMVAARRSGIERTRFPVRTSRSASKLLNPSVARRAQEIMIIEWMLMPNFGGAFCW